MSTCEALVDKGRRDVQGGVVRQPCGAEAVVHVPALVDPLYKFHWCDEHASAGALPWREAS